MNYSESEWESMSWLADQLRVPVKWVAQLIWHESSGNPLAKNQIGARGLIQFLNSTAKGMGYDNADHIVALYPTFDAQIKKPVYDYLKPYKPFLSNIEFFNAVFLPAYRKREYDFQFPMKYQVANMAYKKTFPPNGEPISTPMRYTSFALGMFPQYVRGEVSANELYEANPHETGGVKTLPVDPITPKSEELKKLKQKKNSAGEHCGLDTCGCREILLRIEQMIKEFVK